ncbi:hypothetical protein CPLU01_07715 [Colletotrichum plurivorum]|uniref:Uncharacterized protein n=1 Tax=Colletotrichum plurivorum TaxID=2175906 RepID=A0A8H6NDQ9_9PEZI|nr:hypothetical protein CPLU01_07715 [Colletotrichum plurivorum]
MTPSLLSIGGEGPAPTSREQKHYPDWNGCVDRALAECPVGVPGLDDDRFGLVFGDPTEARGSRAPSSAEASLDCSGTWKPDELLV